MSSESLVEGPGGIMAAWETSGQVYVGKVDSARQGVRSTMAAPGRGSDRKHPVIAVNALGDTLLAWTEGTGWQKGGALAWQAFDREGGATAEKGRIPDGIPVWGLAAAVARSDGSFVIFH